MHVHAVEVPNVERRARDSQSSSQPRQQRCSSAASAYSQARCHCTSCCQLRSVLFFAMTSRPAVSCISRQVRFHRRSACSMLLRSSTAHNAALAAAEQLAHLRHRRSTSSYASAMAYPAIYAGLTMTVRRVVENLALLVIAPGT
eukprot:20704-Heterococcus_DN1.PRE.1